MTNTREESGVFSKQTNRDSMSSFWSSWSLTLPQSSIQPERDCGFQFCPDGRVVQRGLAQIWSWGAASASVAGRGVPKRRLPVTDDGRRCAVPEWNDKALTLVRVTTNASIFASHLMSQATDIIIQTGAGEGIRTLDPNLGKVMLYP